MAFHSLSAQVSCFEFNKLTRWKNKTHIPRPSAKLPLSVPGRCFPAPKCSKTCGYSRLVTQPWGPVSLATDYIVKSIQGASIIFCTTSDWDLSTCWASSDSQPAESHCHSHTWHQLASYRITFLTSFQILYLSFTGFKLQLLRCFFSRPLCTQSGSQKKRSVNSAPTPWFPASFADWVHETTGQKGGAIGGPATLVKQSMKDLDVSCCSDPHEVFDMEKIIGCHQLGAL